MINAVIMGHNFTLVETLPRNNVDIENNILHDQYLSRKELIDDIREAVSANIHWNDLL